MNMGKQFPRMELTTEMVDQSDLTNAHEIVEDLVAHGLDRNTLSKLFLNK